MGNDPIRLILQDGTTFTGKSFGYPGSIAGEVVFNTAMTGYPESLTDPSYCGQILVLTYPLIGNYGVPDDKNPEEIFRFFESDHLHISGLVIADYSEEYSHWSANESLGNWLRKNKVPGITGVDTRQITKILRDRGSMLGKLVYQENDVPFYDPNLDNLVSRVSTKEIKEYGNGQYRIMLVDCGVKFNIIRNLAKRDTRVIRVPWDYDFSGGDWDGLFISNGPGDPKMCKATIENLKKTLNTGKPIMGICLGNQLLALASGADTYKLKYGHRGHNQPVLMAGTNKAFITSQNHGFAIDENTLTKDWKPYFINLNDHTNEGIIHNILPVFSVQFHPEASGGPTDTEFLFDEFLRMVEKYKKGNQ
ncbi:MAG: glutamine-hydrolyzing carbamoyl-phosphate synthase small subunit [Bacteroidota bacterium]|nr:glutamine-hydrolyzing carbamoyl-phosphate synthase small subunit [Bacteroidota bacterium]